jgi:hypothetical protein
MPWPGITLAICRCRLRKPVLRLRRGNENLYAGQVIDAAVK